MQPPGYDGRQEQVASPLSARGTSTERDQQSSFLISPPGISLPKGGGAIRGIGEKFAANPVTGTASMTVPLAVSPGRSGFAPQLSVAYDSAAGNGPFGFGWTLALPSITRKTDKGLPRYRDLDESDVFMLSGAEDLVPVFRMDAAGEQFVTRDGRFDVREDPRTVDNQQYLVRRYRPRIEGLFARIERWTNVEQPSDCFWRSISRENVTTWYGRTAQSRVADPADSSRIFSWLICETYDDKGNVIVYEYKGEDATGVDLTQVNERNRNRAANRYLKHVRYGNHAPYFPKLISDAAWPAPPAKDEWYFELVFDYGEHDANVPLPDDDTATAWPPRSDPFSSYRSAFEVRTYRLCQRALMFHHFDGVEGVGLNCLVRSTDFTYSFERNPADARNPVYSFLRSVSRIGYARDDAPGATGYLSRSLPPLEFEYTFPEVDDTVRDVDAASMDNLPSGLDGVRYQWIDLDGDGLAGVLTEQADGWFYKRNVSPLHVSQDARGVERSHAALAPVELVAMKPNAAIESGEAQFMDLAGDGQPDLVVLDGPTPGFYEHDERSGWNTFRVFTARLNRDSRDPNLRFVDLDGDGHVDALITEDEALVWHPSLAETGFGPAERVPKVRDEEQGPALVFADGTQSIYLADMSGDGLSDLVRIRNGEVCYWPNLGYGRFGAKISMDNAPWFDTPDMFDQRQLRVVDIDGTGTTDLIYLHRDGVRLYFNQSGNSWSAPRRLAVFPPIDTSGSVSAVDLLGNGTACLVWSSALLAESRRPMRYVDLMGGQKPHLLIEARNNLGATTRVDYASSTKFYLQDKIAGTPWITRLPFPVHVVERVSIHDKWRETTFTTSYSYHHGYFDGVEREFRGFSRVETLDLARVGTNDNVGSPYVTADWTLHQPPVKTITWFHTGASRDRERLLSQFATEYFPHGFASVDTTAPGAFRENELPQPDLDAQQLTTEEWREALRACKGMPLRQEAYEIDVDGLSRGEQRPVKLFSTAYHNCHIRRLQPAGENRHAVFLVTESEAVTYHYELDLTSGRPAPDPRVSHTLNLNVDKFGHILQAVVVSYPRFGSFDDDTLPARAVSLTRGVQNELHIAYTEVRYTDNDVDQADHYRLPLPCETQTYHLTGFAPADAGDRQTPDRRDDLYFSLEELRAYRLSERYQTAGTAVGRLEYHEQPRPVLAGQPNPQKRLVDLTRTCYFDDASDTAAPTQALAFGKHGPRGLKYEDYSLALTTELLTPIFGAKLQESIDGTSAQQKLDSVAASGYLSGAALAQRFAPIDTTGEYWMCSGVAGFESTAASHFFLPERYTDSFGNLTRVAYDIRDLFVEFSADARGNLTEVEDFDYRVMAPRAMRDANDNVTRAAFDVFGMGVASALESGGDAVAGLSARLLNPSPAEIAQFFARQPYSDADPRRWLDQATTRFVYSFGESVDANGNVIAWEAQPAAVCAIQRETHVAYLDGDETELQVAIEYCAGSGPSLVKKTQAEPDPDSTVQDPPLQWIATGKTVVNNKGMPVKQYEPYFSTTEHRFDPGEAQREAGLVRILYYDAPGRLIRTEMADGTFSRVEFSPWHVKTFDQNDTATASDWYATRNQLDVESGLPVDVMGRITATPEQRTGWLMARHRDTPGLMLLDSLGRDVIMVTHNRVEDAAGTFTHGGKRYRDDRYVTFTKFDAESKPLWVRDARGNLVTQCLVSPKANDDPSDLMPAGAVPSYDVASNLLFQHSMDGGDRWTLMDAAGRPMLAWDRNHRQSGAALTPEDRLYFTKYDGLHRPVERWLSIDRGAPAMIERFEYADWRMPDDSPTPNLAALQAANLVGGLVSHYEASGLLETISRDFKGNTLEARRRLNNQPQASIVDWQTSPDDSLEDETFAQLSTFDALNRVVQSFNWHRTALDSPVAEYRPTYNRRAFLSAEELTLRRLRGETDISDGPETYTTTVIRDIRYNEKGQKTRVVLGNDTVTRYTYAPRTFRLTSMRTSRTTTETCGAGTTTAFANGQVIQDLRYTYDPVGNITEIRDLAFRDTFFQNRVVEPISRYEYDALNRLVSASGRENGAVTGVPAGPAAEPPGNGFPCVAANAFRSYLQTYRYDAVGNLERLHHEAGKGTWTRRFRCAGDSNRQIATWDTDDEWNAVDPLAVTQYDYDTHGNMLNLQRANPRFNMRWDHRDMIERIDLGNGFAYYQYDAGTQRTRKRVEQTGRIEERIYFGGYELYRRYSGNGNTLLETIESHHVLDGGDRVLLVDDVLTTNRTHVDGTPFATAATFRYQYSNHLGSACLELDDRAAIISYEEYHPYGTSAYRTMKSDTEAPPKRYRYTGMERDEESGLDYFGGRHFSALLAVWLSCDPAGDVTSAANAYAFCSRNPVSRRDPDGRADLQVCTESDGGVAYWKARVQRDFAPGKLRNPYEGIVAAMKSDTRLVLRAMPDGSGYVGMAWVADLEYHRIQQQLAAERHAQTGQNIAGGIFGTIGYAIAGDEGSDVGAIVDQIADGPAINGMLKRATAAKRYAHSPKKATSKAKTPASKPEKSDKAPDKPPAAATKEEPPAADEQGTELSLRAKQQNAVAVIDYNSREGGSFEEHAMADVRPKLLEKFGPDAYHEQETLPGYGKAGGGKGKAQGRDAIPEAFVERPDGTVAIIVDAKSGAVDNAAQLHTYLDHLTLQPEGDIGLLLFLIPEGKRPNLPKSVTDRLAQKIDGTDTKLGDRVKVRFVSYSGWTASYPRKDR